MRSVGRLACVNLEVASVCIKTLEAQVKGANAEFLKMVDKTTQTKENLCARVFLLKLLLKVEKHCADIVVGNSNMLADQAKDYNGMRFRLQEKEDALREKCEEVPAAISELEILRCNAKDFEEELSNA